MISNHLSRRDVFIRVASVFSGLAFAGTVFGYVSKSVSPDPMQNDKISSTAETIHHERDFKASPKRVYSALTESNQFNKVIQLSAAGMSSGNAPIEISNEEGGKFSLFGGHIVGRHIELVPDKRIVQAWRVVDWKPGTYSIAIFQLNEQDAGTRLVFDHTGFPQGLAEHLAEGWRSNYWEPLQKYLA